MNKTLALLTIALGAALPAGTFAPRPAPGQFNPDSSKKANAAYPTRRARAPLSGPRRPL